MTPQQSSQKLKQQQAELKRYIERDAFIFSGLKAHKQLSQALSLLKDDKGAIRPYHQFEQEIVKLNNSYNKSSTLGLTSSNPILRLRLTLTR